MTVDRWSDALVLVAGVLGLIVVVTAWPRRRTHPGRASAPRPPAPSAVLVRLDTIGADARWRIANRHGILDLTVDIVTYRPSGSDLAWISEPIVSPVRLLPGRSTTLPTTVRDPTLTYDVVVAWTLHHLDGGVRTTRTFTIGDDGEETVDAVRYAPGAVSPSLVVLSAVVAVALTGLTLLAAWRLVDGDGTSVARDVSVVPSPVTSSTATTGTTPAPTSAPSIPPAAAVPATTARSAPTTTAPTSTTSTVSTSTTSTSTAGTTTSTSDPADPRRVTIRGRVDTCRFGSDCLIADFTLVGFPRAGDYICEFRDGGRFTFRYVGDGAEEACAASGAVPSITIEVDGIRSATITRASLDGS